MANTERPAPLDPAYLAKTRESSLYMAHTRQNPEKLAEKFTASMLGTLVEPLAEATVSNPFGNEDESGLSMDFLKEEVAAMWGRILAAGHTFDSIKQPIQKALERTQNAHSLTQILAQENNAAFAHTLSKRF